MRYRILGPLEVRHDDGRFVRLSGLRPEKIVAALRRAKYALTASTFAR
ncbi:MAG TPA: hypothetical protein VF070_43870 [Streptosporangiaceae bacterium]